MGKTIADLRHESNFLLFFLQNPNIGIKKAIPASIPRLTVTYQTTLDNVMFPGHPPKTFF
jgi:hypothetical protein